MVLKFVVFLLVFFSVFAGAHALVGARVASVLGLSGTGKTVCWSVVVLLGVVSVGAQFLVRSRVDAGVWGDALTWIGQLWFGLVLLLFVGAVAGDLLALIARFVPGAELSWGRWIRGGMLLLAAVGGVVGAVGATRAPLVREVELRLPGLPAAFDGYRIAQVSDTHVGPILGNAWVRDLVRLVDAAKPDLVACTGDMVDGRIDLLEPVVAPFKGLRAPDGVFFVNGNHDHYSGGADWNAWASRMGFNVLENSFAVVARGDSRLVVAGVPDLHGNVPPDPRSAFAGAPDGFRILLAHQPSQARSAQGLGVGLQLSGHTHGGQIWPFHAFIRLAQPIVAGFAHVGDVPVFVTRGAGFWGPPMRLFARSEIPVLVLRRR